MELEMLDLDDVVRPVAIGVRVVHLQEAFADPAGSAPVVEVQGPEGVIGEIATEYRGVRAGAADQRVVTAAPHQAIVAAEAAERIVGIVAGDRVAATRADDILDEGELIAARKPGVQRRMLEIDCQAGTGPSAKRI